jgi:anti-sigma factor RsiW
MTTCDRIEPELAAYHFNVVDDDVREQIEAHLVECPACVRAFVALKRSIETSSDVPSPSKGVRPKLRDAVARELGLREAKWSWWERPLAIALAASVVLAAGMTTHALTSAPASPPYGVAQGTVH